MKCGALVVRLLLPLLAQKLSIPRRGMELQGAQMLEGMASAEGISEGLPVAVLSTQARPQRVNVSKEMPLNKFDIVRTLVTFQLARSLVKEVAPLNV